MRLSISIVAMAAVLSAGTHAFVVPTNSAMTRSSTCKLGMSSVAEPEAAADTAAVVADAPASDAAPSADVNVDAGDRQKLYGNDIDLPETYVMCGRCKTAYALQPDDLGPKGKGRRIECTVCSHSWYQARDRLFTLNDQHELVPAPEHHLSRVASNIAADREPSYAGEFKLYVGNLDFYTTAEQLRATFAEKGEVGDVNIITGEDGRSRGFAFVTMMTEEGGKKAEELDGEDVGGRNLVVRPPNN